MSLVHSATITWNTRSPRSKDSIAMSRYAVKPMRSGTSPWLPETQCSPHWLLFCSLTKQRMTLASFTLKDKQRLQDNRQMVSTVDVSRSGTFAYATIRGFQPIADRFCRQSWEVPSSATALYLTKTMQEDARQRNMGTTLFPSPLASAQRTACM